MKVGFNARLLVDPTIRGWNRYTVNLMTELSAIGVPLVLYSHAPVHPTHLSRLRPGGFDLRVSPPMRYITWENRWLARQVEADGVDVLHCPFHFGLPWGGRFAKVLTLHDCIDVRRRATEPLGAKLRPGQLQVSFSLYASRRRADQIITVSQYSRDDLQTYLKLPPEKLTVIPEAAEARFHEHVSDNDLHVMRTTLQLDRPYVFYIGGWDERKNVDVLVDAFLQSGVSDVDLLLAGGTSDQRAAMTRRLSDRGATDRVKLLTFVDDALLPALYTGATGFIYPSLLEGFGLQLCEAMAAGCPVLCSRATSLPEVLGEGGVLFDPTDVAALSKLIHQLCTDTSFRSALATRSKTRGRHFSWRDTARQTLAVYERAVALRR